MTRPKPPNYARPCRSGRHEIPAGVMSCSECNREIPRTPRTVAEPRRTPPENARRYLGHRPPDDVLTEAACGPATAELFDQAQGSGQVTEEDRRRIAQAKAICARCPVQEACFADAIAHREYGVRGGVYLYPKWYDKPAHKALVQSVKSQVA